MTINSTALKLLGLVFASAFIFMLSAQENADPFVQLLNEKSEVRLQAWAEIVKMGSLDITQIGQLLVPVKEYRPTIPRRYLNPTDGVALAIDLLGHFKVIAAIPELLRVKSFAVFEAVLCEEGADEIRIFYEDFVAAKALIAIGDSSLPAIESELALGAPTDLDAQLDGLIYLWIAGKEKAIEVLKAKRTVARTEALKGYDIALKVVENYNDAWCFDGEQLVPPGKPVPLEEIIEEYKKREKEEQKE